MILLITISLYCIQLSKSHSFQNGAPRNVTCVKPNPAKIYSWHIHLLYFQINAKHTEGAYKIRDHFIDTFKEKLGPQCTDLFDEKQLCMFEPDREPVGPFLTAQWSVFVTIDTFYETVSWIMQNKGIYDILVHPNTGCEMEDHDDWAFWGGKPWRINMDAFSHDKPFPWRR